ncbi:hypothetical protein pneo_cds_652 [Pandoravirus neocaledonia]|uniref:Uncharacterized protein n=1 Tax=Pandoravirus neocaledonia TaxID=2107708 RepID=A0A2U7UCR4_9VIRU|nr:hypothetical protein pneo_cds_652 [Pandoravirus neocaledonia]AVK76259.1 hypothetical protein pneo_cds_652 [Pandoravirus neocaledonia]
MRSVANTTTLEASPLSPGRDNNNSKSKIGSLAAVGDSNSGSGGNKKGPRPLTGDARDDRSAIDLFGAWYLDDGARLYGLKPNPDDIERVWQYMLPPRAPSPSAKWCRAYWMRQEAANVAARWGDAQDVAAQNVRKTIDGMFASLADVVRQITRTGKNARGHDVLVMVTHALEEAGWRFVLRRTQSNARERVIPLDSVDALVSALAIVLAEEPEIDAVQCYLGSAAHGSLVGWDAMFEARRRRHPQTMPDATSSAAPSTTMAASLSPPLPVTPLATPRPVSGVLSRFDRPALPVPTIAPYPAYAAESLLHTGFAVQGARGASTRVGLSAPCAQTRRTPMGGGHVDEPICIDIPDTIVPFDLDLNNPPAEADDAAWAAIAATQANCKRRLDLLHPNGAVRPDDEASRTKRLRSTSSDDAHARRGDCRAVTCRGSTESVLPGALGEFFSPLSTASETQMPSGQACEDTPNRSRDALSASSSVSVVRDLLRADDDRDFFDDAGQSRHCRHMDDVDKASRECQGTYEDDRDQDTDDEVIECGTVNRSGTARDVVDDGDETEDEEQGTAGLCVSARTDASPESTLGIRDDATKLQGGPGDETSQSGDDDDNGNDRSPAVASLCTDRNMRRHHHTVCDAPSIEHHDFAQRAQRYRRDIQDALYRVNCVALSRLGAPSGGPVA